MKEVNHSHAVTVSLSHLVVAVAKTRKTFIPHYVNRQCVQTPTGISGFLEKYIEIELQQS